MVTRSGPATVLGVVGGMGPLASAAFVQTVYEQAIREREQEGPVVLMVSNPTVPDRTEALLRGEEGELLAYLAESLAWLADGGAGRMVIPCVTAHHLWGKLPREHRARTRSLIDQAFDDLEASPGRHLLLATSGTRKLGIFQGHPRWPRVADRIELPDEADQETLHRLLYRLKLCAPPAEAVPEVRRLLAKYGARVFLAGCTELHLLTRHLVAVGEDLPFVDPLMSIARAFAGEAASG